MIAHAFCLLLAGATAQAQVEDGSDRLVLEQPATLEVDSEVAIERELSRLRLGAPAATAIIGGVFTVGLIAGTIVSAFTMGGCSGDVCTVTIAPMVMGSLIVVPLTVAIVGSIILARRLRRHRELEQRLSISF